MEREIVTYPLDNHVFRQELLFVLNHYTDSGEDSCEIMFGFAWGIDYYPDDNWEFEKIAISNIPGKIAQIENMGFGQLGYNDLFIRLSNLEFHFCNDSDIHLKYASPNDEVEFFYKRWQSKGYKPGVWLNSPSGQKVKLNSV